MSESNTDFMIGENIQEIQIGSGTSTTEENFTSNNANNSPVDGLQVNVLRLERSMTGEVVSEVDTAMTTVETKLLEAVLTAIGKFSNS